MSKRKQAESESELPEPQLLSKRKQSATKIGAQSQKMLNSFFTIPDSFTVPVVMRGQASQDDFTDSQAKIYQWNINGTTVFEKGTLQEFMHAVNPDVLCLNEIKTDPEKIDKKKLFLKLPPGYASYWNCSKAKLGYSGTAIITKVKPLSVQFDFGTEHTTEGRSITMEFRHFVLVAAYVPNAGDELKRLDYRINDWDAQFHEYLKALEQRKGKPVILAGDLNVALNEKDIYDVKGKEKVAGYSPQER
jgi:exodeoxyribonuclease-3